MFLRPRRFHTRFVLVEAIQINQPDAAVFLALHQPFADKVTDVVLVLVGLRCRLIDQYQLGHVPAHLFSW